MRNNYENNLSPLKSLHCKQKIIKIDTYLYNYLIAVKECKIAKLLEEYPFNKFIDYWNKTYSINQQQNGNPNKSLKWINYPNCNYTIW